MTVAAGAPVTLTRCRLLELAASSTSRRSIASAGGSRGGLRAESHRRSGSYRTAGSGRSRTDMDDRRLRNSLIACWKLFTPNPFAVGEAGNDAADLVDDLRLIRTERGGSFRMPGSSSSASASASRSCAEALGERLRDGYSLPVAAERERVQVMRIRVAGCRSASHVGPLRRLLEQRETDLRVGLDVIRVDALRLDGRVDAGFASRAPGGHGFLERAGVEMPPRVGNRGILGERLAVALVQASPRLLQRRTRIRVRSVRMREPRPFFRPIAPLPRSTSAMRHP